MSLDRISIESDIQEVTEMLHVEPLKLARKNLNLQKGVIYYIITDDELLEINRDVLNHDYYTDIITFDYEDDEDIEDNEVLVSWDRVKENANLNEVTSINELYRVCFHGLLHLAGYKDNTDKQKKEMREQENILLELYCST